MGDVLTRCGLALLLTGCSVELHDVAGRACDEAHPCRAPRSCVDGACVDRREDAGVTAAPRWEQRLHGFDATTVDPSCSLTIDASRGNLVVASIAGPHDDDDTALARVTDPARLPATTEGRLRGRVSSPLAVSVRDEVPVLVLYGEAGRAWLRAGFDGAGRLVVRSDAQTLGDAELVERFAVDGGFGPDERVLAFDWRAGAFRRVFVDDVMLADTAVSGGATAAPGALALGVERYAGDAGTAFTIRHAGWRLADSLDVALGDVP